MASMMSWWWRPSTLQPTDWAIPRISVTVPESSLAKDQCHVSRVMWTISSKVVFPLCLVVCLFFCFFLFSWRFFEGFDDQGGGRRYSLSLGLSVLNGQFHCNPQTIPITGCFGDIITKLFLKKILFIYF